MALTFDLWSTKRNPAHRRHEVVAECFTATFKDFNCYNQLKHLTCSLCKHVVRASKCCVHSNLSKTGASAPTTYCMCPAWHVAQCYLCQILSSSTWKKYRTEFLTQVMVLGSKLKNRKWKNHSFEDSNLSTQDREDRWYEHGIGTALPEQKGL